MVHGVSDGLSVREDLRQVPGAQDVPQGGGSQQPRRPVVVVIVADCAQWVGNLPIMMSYFYIFLLLFIDLNSLLLLQKNKKHLIYISLLIDILHCFNIKKSPHTKLLSINVSFQGFVCLASGSTFKTFLIL